MEDRTDYQRFGPDDEPPTAVPGRVVDPRAGANPDGRGGSPHRRGVPEGPPGPPARAVARRRAGRRRRRSPGTGAARPQTMAAVYDRQHEYPDDCLMPDPETGRADQRQPHAPSLEGGPAAPPPRAGAHRRAVGRADGPHARLHERHVRRLRRRASGVARPGGPQRGGRREPRRLPAPARPRGHLPHPHDRPPDRRPGSRPGLRRQPGATAQGGRRPAGGIVVRGARILATLAPFADELAVYPGHPLAARCAAPSTRSASRSRWTRPASCSCAATARRRRVPIRFDRPLSSRFDEQDAFVIFDDVEVPRHRVFIDADPDVYNSVMGPTAWWAEHHAADHDPGPHEARVRLRPGHPPGRGGERQLAGARSRCSASCTATWR